MIAKVVRIYGGMPEDWLSAPYLHFICMWNQLQRIQMEEWTGMAIAYHDPKSLSKMGKDIPVEKPAQEEPLPQEESAKRKFYQGQAEKLMRLINGGGR